MNTNPKVNTNQKAGPAKGLAPAGFVLLIFRQNVIYYAVLA
jgi:hypothetical protein